jgi:ankyrin repeat protein
MNKFKRYAIKLGIASLAFFVSLALYLVVPPLSSSIRDLPHEAPVAFVPDEQNKGERCRPETVYVDKKYQIADHEVVHPFCADLQEKLSEAAAGGNIAEMRALLARGANLSSVGVTELAEPIGSPLPLAAERGHWDAVRFLLDDGGDVNAEYVCCATRASLLILAVYQHNVDAVRLLLARGADVKLTDFDGETAFEAAARNGYDDVARLFDEAGRLTWTQRAELRIAKLPGMNLKRAHAAFIKLGLVKNINHGVY